MNVVHSWPAYDADYEKDSKIIRNQTKMSVRIEK
jgi:hypothetical protein